MSSDSNETESGIWYPGTEVNIQSEENPSMETEERLREIAMSIRPHGYFTLLCTCDWAYIGARKAGTPCCCEACGYMTVEYFDALVAAVYEGMDHE